MRAVMAGRGDGGVGEVPAYAAEEHLDDDNGERRAHDGDIEGHDGRQIEREDDARHHGGKIPHGLLALGDHVEHPFTEDRRSDA